MITKDARLLLVVDAVVPEGRRRPRLDLHAAAAVAGDVIPLVSATAAIVDNYTCTPIATKPVADYDGRRPLLHLGWVGVG